MTDHWRQKACTVVLIGFVLAALPFTFRRVVGQDAALSDGAAGDVRALPVVFEEAAAAWDVPVELLLTLAWMGSGFEDRGDAPTLEGGYGLMALRSNEWFPDGVDLAAELVGVDPVRVVEDPAANIQGAAALLDLFARQADLDRSQGIVAWQDALIRYAGLDEESSRLFAADVFGKVARGFTVTNSRGETFVVEPTRLPVEPLDLMPSVVQPTYADYPAAIWDPAPDCNCTRVDFDKNAIVIHMLEGTVAGALAQFKQCDTQASVHYIVSESGTIWQMVRESHLAWHVGCQERRTIGIAHEGFSTSPTHPQTLYSASARLAKAVCQRWGIPRRAMVDGGAGIVGHDELNACCCQGLETDPGPGWDWDGYLSRINDGQPAPAVTAVVSRKDCGDAGVCDLDLMAGSAVEARPGGPTRLVVMFDQPVEGVDGLSYDDVQLSAGRVALLAIDNCQLTIETRDVPDGQYLSVGFPGIAAVGGPFVTGELRLGVLAGDVDGNGYVEILDLCRLRDALVQPARESDCQQDLGAFPNVTIHDMVFVRDHLGGSLPAE